MTTKKHYDITVAVPTLNGEEFLEQLIKAVYSQKTNLRYELLIIDSGSTDRTIEIIKKHPKIRLHQIPNSEFGHGKTRNLAAQISDSTFMVFLTQDAVPASENWLSGMIEPFMLNDRIVGVFGKQIPRADCSVTIKREVKSVFDSLGPDLSIMIQRHGDLIKALGWEDASGFFSDVNSAIRSSVLKTSIPFRDVAYAEDQAFGRDALNHGYQKAYAPLGAVFHSNDYNLSDYYRRKFDEAYGLNQATGLSQSVSLRELIKGTAKATLLDWRFALLDREYSMRKKGIEFLKSPLYNLAVRLSIRKAAQKLTTEQVASLSLEHKIKSKSRSN